jgi:hypothetical protein
MKNYHIHRLKQQEGQYGEVIVRVIENDLPQYDLSPYASQQLRTHSPVGFEFGYIGRGPAQLALAILLDATGSERIALRWYNEFKFEFIANIENDGGMILGEDIAQWIEQHEAS